MDGDLHDIDDLFREAIGEHEDIPSASVWDKLDKDLDKRKVVSISRKYYTLKWVAAALFIFSSAAAMYTWKVKSDMSNQVKESAAHSERSSGRSSNSSRPGEVNPAQADSAADTASTSAGDIAISSNKKIDQPNTQTPSPQIGTSQNLNSQSATPPISTLQPDTPLRKSPTLKDLQEAKNPGESDITSSVKKAGSTKKPGSKLVLNNTAGTGKAGEKFTPQPDDQQVNNAGNKVANNKVTAREKSLTYRQKEDRRLLDLAAKTANGKSQGAGNTSLLPGAAPRDIEARNLAVTADFLSAKPFFISPLSLMKKPSVKKTDLYQPSINAVTAKLHIARQSAFSLMPYYSFDHVSSRVDNDHPRFREEDRKEIKDKEEIGMTRSMGLIVGYSLNDKWSIESGLTLATLTTTIEPKTIFARPDMMGNVNFRFNSSAGYSVITLKSFGSTAPVSGDSLHALSSTSALKYVSIPLNVRYKISSGKISFNPGIGLAANFLASGKIDTEISSAVVLEKPGSGKIEGLNSMYMNGLLSLGMNYSINKIMAITLMPTLRFGINSINKETPVKTVLNTYGLGAGLTISL